MENSLAYFASLVENKTVISAPVISIVSPIHCEEAGINAFLNKLEEVLNPLKLSYEVLLIDDGSTDNSWQRATEEARVRPYLRCLRLSRNFGKEAALVAGIEAAQGQAVITLDSDLQHPPDCIPEMIRLWQVGDVDIIDAQKSQRQKESAISRFFAKSFYALFALVSPFDLSNASDFKLMNRKAINAWKQLAERRVFFRGMSSWIGFRRKIIYFEPLDRHSGVSQWSLPAKIVLALSSLSSYSTALLVLVWVLSFIFALFALFVGGEAVLMKFHGKALPGFTTVILLILITGTAVLGSLCLLSLYIRQIFHEVKARPRYLISEQVGYENQGKSNTLKKRNRSNHERNKQNLNIAQRSKGLKAKPPKLTSRHASKARQIFLKINSNSKKHSTLNSKNDTNTIPLK